jgi:hypothetical protein
MKKSGISSWGIRPVSADIPKMMVNITENTAAGMLRSWVWAIVL